MILLVPSGTGIDMSINIGAAFTVMVLQNDPGLCTLTEVALKGFLAERHIKECSNLSDTSHYDEDIKNGKQAAKTVCQYVDWLFSTVNPTPPDEEIWIRPEVHPCKRRHEDIS